VKRTAASPFPRIIPSVDELRDGEPSRDTVDDAVRLFRAHGCVQIDGVFRTDLLRKVRKAYLERYVSHFEKPNDDDILRVSARRVQITVEITPPFNSPALYANPFVYPILEELLGSTFVLNSFGSVVSLPGAPNQHVHRDHPALFDTHPADLFSPPFAITVIVPLVDMNAMTGTTRMLPGSHVLFDEEGLSRPSYDPEAPVGSCLLMDYRLIHYGLANSSDLIRPILYVVYSRYWFRDYANFTLREPIVLKRSEYERVPKKWRRLFALASVTD
jgi:ectoine hydroxylase-related dioxygenase (phytanoyl-CoA dioxygenase family)